MIHTATSSYTVFNVRHTNFLAQIKRRPLMCDKRDSVTTASHWLCFSLGNVITSQKLIEKKLADCSRKAPVFAVSSSPPPPRSLASNAAALRLLNHKAERMFNIDVRVGHMPNCLHLFDWL